MSNDTPRPGEGMPLAKRLREFAAEFETEMPSPGHGLMTDAADDLESLDKACNLSVIRDRVDEAIRKWASESGLPQPANGFAGTIASVLFCHVREVLSPGRWPKVTDDIRTLLDKLGPDWKTRAESAEQSLATLRATLAERDKQNDSAEWEIAGLKGQVAAQSARLRELEQQVNGLIELGQEMHRILWHMTKAQRYNLIADWFRPRLNALVPHPNDLMMEANGE